MAKLLVVSVYAPDTWDLYRWQSWYLRQTTNDYEHVIVSAQKPPFEIRWFPPQDGSHTAGLSAAVEFVRRTKGQYHRICLLDSDAFPVRADWQVTLDRAMTQTASVFAAPVRTENYDCFPHISFIYTSTDFFLAFRRLFAARRGRSVHGEPVGDIGAGLPLRLCVCLLKSNVYSPHPLLHSVYGDVVYHHGAGSRPNTPSGWPPMRGWKQWRWLMPKYAHAQPQDPMPEFINRLVGEERFVGDIPLA